MPKISIMISQKPLGVPPWRCARYLGIGTYIRCLEMVRPLRLLWCYPVVYFSAIFLLFFWLNHFIKWTDTAKDVWWFSFCWSGAVVSQRVQVFEHPFSWDFQDNGDLIGIFVRAHGVVWSLSRVICWAFYAVFCLFSTFFFIFTFPKSMGGEGLTPFPPFSLPCARIWFSSTVHQYSDVPHDRYWNKPCFTYLHPISSPFVMISAQNLNSQGSK